MKRSQESTPARKPMMLGLMYSFVAESDPKGVPLCWLNSDQLDRSFLLTQPPSPVSQELDPERFNAYGSYFRRWNQFDEYITSVLHVCRTYSIDDDCR